MVLIAVMFHSDSMKVNSSGGRGSALDLGQARLRVEGEERQAQQERMGVSIMGTSKWIAYNDKSWQIPLKCMIKWGTPILGNLHIITFDSHYWRSLCLASQVSVFIASSSVHLN